MNNTLKIITAILLTFILTRTNAQNSKLILTLQVSKMTNKLPANGEDWFAVDFVCIIKNISTDTIYFVNPQAYRIYPHPWSIAINGTSAEFWSGDIMCAPSFTEKDIFKLTPGDIAVKQFEWHTFVQNFTTKPGTYKAKVRYSYAPKKNGIIFRNTKKITATETGYSNEVLFKIEK